MAASKENFDTTTNSMKSFRERFDELTKSFVIVFCCAECVVEKPNRPKGEYYLVREENIEDHVFASVHDGCRKTWIMAKEQQSSSTVVVGERWYRIRHTETSPGPSGVYGLCEYAIDASDDKYLEKDDCPIGDSCNYAHNEVECQFWTELFRLRLKFSTFHHELLPAARKSIHSAEPFFTATTNRFYPFQNPPHEFNKSDRRRQRGAEKWRNPHRQEKECPSVIIDGPRDAISPSFRYSDQPLERDKKNQKIIFEVLISKFDSPDNFYIQVRKEAEMVKEYLKEMNEFYDSESSTDYAVKDEYLRQGLAIAKRTKTTDGRYVWRRGEVIDYATGRFEILELADVDYGGLEYMKLKDIRLLRQSYAVFPRQAIPATLAYVGPFIYEKWSKQAVEFTRAFLSKDPLTADVVGTWKSKLAVVIGDNSDPKHSINIQNLLMKKRYASSFKFQKPEPLPGGGGDDKSAGSEASQAKLWD